MQKYARDEPKEELEDQLESKQAERQQKEESQQAADAKNSIPEITDANFTSTVENSKEAALVIYTTLPASKDLSSEWKSFTKVHR